MQRIFINGVNWTLLILIFIGVPAITRRQVGHLQISSVPPARELMFWGLGLAIIANIFGATIMPLGIKSKTLCAKWTFIFGGLLLLEYAFVRGYFNFDWLKKSLAWFQKHF